MMCLAKIIQTHWAHNQHRCAVLHDIRLNYKEKYKEIEPISNSNKDGFTATFHECADLVDPQRAAV